MGKKFFLPCAVVFILIGLIFTIPAPEADAAGTVGTGTPGSCTEAAFDAALVGGGTVDFNCGGAATITFTSTKNITIATTISGGDVITLSGGNAVKLFTVSGSGLMLTLSHISLVNGRDSAGNPGAAAIVASAGVTINASTISGHQTTHGGCPAIRMAGDTLFITRSTITGNVHGTSGSGQAICANATATLNIDNSTITGNTGGAIRNSGTATLVHCTIAGNTFLPGSGSGIVNFEGITTLINTIVANNTGVGQCHNILGGSVVDGGGNLQFPDATCGVAITVADPLLEPLANNGGPTQTMSLPSNSPAVDSVIEAAGFTIDQRNLPRPVDIPNIGNEGTGTADIGAFELQLNEIRTAIPSMTQWGMIIFIVLAGLGAVYSMRRQRKAKS